MQSIWSLGSHAVLRTKSHRSGTYYNKSHIPNSQIGAADSFTLGGTKTLKEKPNQKEKRNKEKQESQKEKIL